MAAGAVGAADAPRQAHRGDRTALAYRGEVGAREILNGTYFGSGHVGDAPRSLTEGERGQPSAHLAHVDVVAVQHQ
jgi:hypothetical protein